MIKKAAAILNNAVERGQIPGGALGIAWVDGRKESFFAGQAQIEPASIPLEPSLFFDLASLTKVIFTVTEVMRLVEDGLADLDDSLSRFMPEMGWMQGSELPKRTLRQLLTHTSGLPAWAPMYTWNSEPNTLKHQILQHAWPINPVGQTVYSDIGYILLGLVLERVRGKLLGEFDQPDGLMFKPKPEQSVATERCPWRGRVLRGEVHDENSFALGDATGHAGLFGTLDGVLGFARGMLDGSVLSPAALAELRRPQTEERGLGWILAGNGYSGGSLCSRSTIGHTGFTGTGLWIDFERGYAWTLLTNRVHPSRHVETGIIELRKAVGNAIAAAWRV
jgi:CubicO group peptidase (beta-lactamase class C family)